VPPIEQIAQCQTDAGNYWDKELQKIQAQHRKERMEQANIEREARRKREAAKLAEQKAVEAEKRKIAQEALAA